MHIHVVCASTQTAQKGLAWAMPNSGPLQWVPARTRAKVGALRFRHLRGKRSRGGDMFRPRAALIEASEKEDQGGDESSEGHRQEATEATRSVEKGLAETGSDMRKGTERSASNDDSMAGRRMEQEVMSAHVCHFNLNCANATQNLESPLRIYMRSRPRPRSICNAPASSRCLPCRGM